MKDTRLVLKLPRPGLHRVIPAAAGGLVLLVLWGVYELGQLRGGHQWIQHRSETAALERELSTLRSENMELQERLARADSRAQVNTEAYRQVEARLAELQETVLAQEEDLEFFRRLLSESREHEGIRVQELDITAAEAPGHWLVRIVLARPAGPESRATGRLDLVIDGQQAERELRLELAEIGAAESASDELEFDFRYFQNLQTELQLPADFRPEALLVRVLPDNEGEEPGEHRFDWPDAGNALPTPVQLPE